MLSAVVFGSSVLFADGGLAACTPADKIAKATVCAMDHALVGLGDSWKNYDIWSKAMEPFWAKDFIYTPMYGINETVGLKDWYFHECIDWDKAFPAGLFNQMLFLGDDVNASSMTYAIGVWEDKLGPLAPTFRRANVRIMDAYHVNGHQILHNWMMIDMLDLLRQAGRHPLPLSPLPQGRDFPPMAMEGLPAPLSPFVKAEDTESSRQVVLAVLSAEWEGASDAMAHWSEDMIWYGPVPFGMARGKAEYRRYFLKPLHEAFGDRRVSLDTIACEGQFCATHGDLTGVHVGTWLGHEATHAHLRLNFGMHWHVEEGQITESWAIFDLARCFSQIGVDLLGVGLPSGTSSSPQGPRTLYA